MKLTKLQCPRLCGNLLNIVLDECVTSEGLIVGYCYDPSHAKLKVKIVNKLRMENESKLAKKFSMAGLGCIFCGNKDMWFLKKKSNVAENRIIKECKGCRIGLKYLGKLVPNCLPYEEIIRIKIVPFSYNT